MSVNELMYWDESAMNNFFIQRKFIYLIVFLLAFSNTPLKELEKEKLNRNTHLNIESTAAYFSFSSSVQFK